MCLDSGKTRITRMPQVRANREVLIVALSLLLQVPLAVFLGHYYDDKVFMATGYLVSSGLNPYLQYDFTNVFVHPLLGGIAPSVGYPPPWPLVLGLIYRMSYAVVPNVFLYNFAIKVPIIAANIAIAYIVRNIMVSSGYSAEKARVAWLFLLFNPFVLLTTSAWGQFDSLVALLCVGSLYLLSKGRHYESALSLGIGVAAKPIALPLIVLPFLFHPKEVTTNKLRYGTVLAGVLLGGYFLPFLLMGWSLPFAPNQWDTQLLMAGGMTPFNLLEMFQASSTLPSALGFLGFLWLPALVAGCYVVYRSPPTSMKEMTQKAAGLMLIFFLTRSWLSEPNINVVLPLMLLAVKPDEMNFRNFHFLWSIPLVFMFLNLSFPQLFFLVYPSVLTSIAEVDQQIQTARLVARFAVVILWQILAWRIVAKTLSKNDP